MVTLVACTASSSRPAVQAHASSNSCRVLAFKRIVTSLGAATVVLSTAAAPALAADLILGEEVFNNNCAACHMGGRNTVQVEKTLQKAALEQYLAGGLNMEAITTQVTDGKGAMPAWGDRLSEEEIEAVANYVFDQASNNKW
ncbi:hypothetical protein N2152v2_003049 [Parachlorella kessleri]